MKQIDDALTELLESSGEPGSLEVVTQLSQALSPRTPTRALRSRLLEKAQSPALRWAPHFDKLSALFDLDEPALTHIAVQSCLEQRWESLPLAGVRLFHLQGGPALAGADAGLVAIAAGTRFPHHRHLGQERTLILEGGLREDDGTLYRAGDALTMAAGSSHAFRVLESAQLVYAVVLFAPIEIEGVRFPPSAR